MHCKLIIVIKIIHVFNPPPRGHEMYNFGKPFRGHHYYTLRLSDLCSALEDRILKKLSIYSIHV